MHSSLYEDGESSFVLLLRCRIVRGHPSLNPLPVMSRIPYRKRFPVADLLDVSLDVVELIKKTNCPFITDTDTKKKKM